MNKLEIPNKRMNMFAERLLKVTAIIAMIPTCTANAATKQRFDSLNIDFHNEPNITPVMAVRLNIVMKNDIFEKSLNTYLNMYVAHVTYMK